MSELREQAGKVKEAARALAILPTLRKNAILLAMAEALEKQDLFINSTLAQLGCNILWRMFRHGLIEHHGLYLNLETMKVNPIPV